MVSEAELALPGSPKGTLVSKGTPEWVINRRSISVGMYQVKFVASITIVDQTSHTTLTAFDYGFIWVEKGPVRAIIDGGSRVRWGSVDIIVADGSLSYDADLGPGNRSGLVFSWSCRELVETVPLSDTCFGAFLSDASKTNVSIDPSRLMTGKTYVLGLNVSKDDRSDLAEMKFEVVGGTIPQVTLR